MKRAARARDLGIPFEGDPGPNNAITDVEGVEVGHTTLIGGNPPLVVGQGPVRTGVTAVLPLGKECRQGVFASTFALNGNGEMTGVAYVEEFGILFGPIMLTNTHSVGAVHEATVKWMQGLSRQASSQRTFGNPKSENQNPKSMALPWSLPVVAETYDGQFNDINGFHVREAHVIAALERAAPGPVHEGSVGGGTGMSAYGFKAGIGTASRKLEAHTVGVLVQANHGRMDQLRIAGLPIGKSIQVAREKPSSSIIVVIATDAPFLPNQLKAFCKRGAMGLARTGSAAAMTSGDLFIAFSTSNRVEGLDQPFSARSVCLGDWSGYFEAVAQATEEAIVNALAAAEPMIDLNGHLAPSLSQELFKGVREQS